MALPPVLDEENLYKFRTKICERYVKQGKCEFADKCQYSHDLRWTRRPPWKYTYSPELCRDLVFVTDGRGRTIAKSNCKQKRNCRFAHTKEEQMYHPKVYKTAMCHQFKEDGWCDRYYCPFAHSEGELRHTEQSDENRKTFSKPAVQEALCPDIYLPSDRPHPRLRARFLAIMDGISSHNHLHLALEPNYLPNAVGTRTRQPYTDFISSHTPHSVLSETSPPAHTYGQQNGAAYNGNAIDIVSGTLNGNSVGSRAAKSSANQLCASRQQTNGKEPTGEKRNLRTTSRLVQLLQAKQYSGNNTGVAASSRPTASSSLQSETYHHALHDNALRKGISSALTSMNDVPPYGSACASTHSAASAQQWTSMPGSPSANRMHVPQTDFSRSEGPLTTQNTFIDSSMFGAFPTLVQQGERRQNKASTCDLRGAGSGGPFGAMYHSAGGLGALLAGVEGGFGNQHSKPQIETAQTGALQGCSAWGNVDRYPAEPDVANSKTTATSDFRVKSLTSDIFYWNEPIGRSRDDPSVLVYTGLILGPGKAREVVAVKQLPVVVLNRVGELWREVQRFLSISDPHLVNIKRALFLPGEADEGTSLWVVTEKCQGSIVDMFPAGAISPSFLQASFLPTGLNGLLHYLLRAIQTLHSQSQGAHMRIHPGNIMIGCNGEVKLGDCAGKIRYLSILDLLHAGLQGASNAKALLQWILGTPQETCWMAPEFLTSLLDLDEELSQALWHSGNSADESKNEKAFAEVARKFRWPADFLRRADAWSAGATLFYIASGGLHPYGSANDPLTLANILADKKINIDKLNNCPWLADLLAGLLCHKPAQRLSIVQALHHPFFWTSEDIEKYLEDLRAALEEQRTEASTGLQEALSYSINWVESLAYIRSPVPLLPLLLSYMAPPSASPQLLAAHPHQNASSFLVFLALVTGDKRIALADRRLIVSECLMAHAASFLHSVYLFLFPKIANDRAADQGSSGSTTCTPKQYCWHPSVVTNAEKTNQYLGLSGDIVRNLSASALSSIQNPAYNVDSITQTQSFRSRLREDVSGCWNDQSGNARTSPPPYAGTSGLMHRETINPCGVDDNRAELVVGPQRRDFRAPLPHLGSAPHKGNNVDKDAEMLHRAVASGAESIAEVAHRTALGGNKMTLHVQELMKAAAAFRPQQKTCVLRGLREAGNSDRVGRPDGSPVATTRLAKEMTRKGTKSDAKQKNSGVTKEMRWPCGGDRLGAKQQNETQPPPGIGKSVGLWATSSGTVDGKPSSHVLKETPVVAVRGQSGPVMQTTLTKEQTEISNSGDKLMPSNSPPLGVTAPGSKGLQTCKRIQEESHCLQEGAEPLRDYADETSETRGKLAMGQVETKYSLEASSALLQMPVAVSTVSTAFPSATATDFCNAHSQPTDSGGEAGSWKHEQQALSTEGSSKEAAKSERAEERASEDAGKADIDKKAPDATGAKETTSINEMCQANSERESLRREASNACIVQ